ncbi:60S ribosomal protein L10 [Mucor velutinosus]|uniref:60S ribosomal protein L10 n=2 Tax=Mucor TaxID=4830 RepID=A0AAN7DKR9_9FUNG|nr:60S ribosomal protein L10 [Mucor velutinosus]
MTQTDNNSYFSLKNPSINNKPQPTTSSVNTSATSTPKVKSGLLNRRQQHASAAYLQPLELPSLPPLSQLLPNKKEQQQQQQQQQPAANTQVSTDATAATVAAAVAAGMIPHLSYPTHPQPIQPKSNNVLFNDFNTNNKTAYPTTSNTTTSANVPAGTTTTTNMAQLMDPVAAAAAAVAANDFSANLPLDSIYNMPSTVASMDQTVTTAPSSMYLSNYDPNLMQQQTQPPAALVMQQPPLQAQAQAQHQQQRARQLSSSSSSSAEKQYSFVAIPGTNQKKRPRRRYDEIERLYHCTWPGCSKAYGTLNHLNAHVSMQKHGPKRHPAEFKEMRKLWRKQKKEREAHKKRNEEAMKQHMMNPPLPLPATQQQQPQQTFSFNGLPVNGFY